MYKQFKILIVALLTVALVGCTLFNEEGEGSEPELNQEIVERPSGRVERDLGSRVSSGTFFSEALGINRSYYIYLPEEYNEDEEASFPVLYLLRAGEGELVAYGVDAFERLRKEEKVGPMILVFPNTGRGIAVNYVNPHPRFGTSQFEDYFIKDLIPHIDSNYRTIGNKYGRAIDGFSLGGFSSLLLALKNPDMFASVGSFDGRITPHDDTDFFTLYDEYSFGVPFDREYYVKNNPANLMRDGKFEDLDSLAYHIQYATIGRSNASENANFIRILEERGLQNSLGNGLLEESKHTYPWASRHFEITIPLHYNEFKLDD